MILDKNKREIRVGDLVLIHQKELDVPRRARVVELTLSATMLAAGYWVDVDGGQGIEGLPSYILEVIDG